MKLLSTIAAVLISISAFSQDYVEYNEGTFSSNGKELSLDKVELIMKQYRVPFYRARLQSVKKQMRNCDKKLIRYVTVAAGTLGTISGAPLTVLFGALTVVGAYEDIPTTVVFGTVTAGFAALTASYVHLAFVHSTEDRCQNKVDKLCENLVFQLNKKILAKHKLLGY
ncbi:hypothetical protein N9J67_00445 [Schleiferiaceae bacterium]|nr:hypothetical protein [Schleiferiaceae bacterium]